jgi:hypothetical protein
MQNYLKNKALAGRIAWCCNTVELTMVLWWGECTKTSQRRQDVSAVQCSAVYYIHHPPTMKAYANSPTFFYITLGSSIVVDTRYTMDSTLRETILHCIRPRRRSIRRHSTQRDWIWTACFALNYSLLRWFRSSLTNWREATVWIVIHSWFLQHRPALSAEYRRCHRHRSKDIMCWRVHVSTFSTERVRIEAMYVLLIVLNYSYLLQYNIFPSLF